jgi:methionyl-tRNA formyltransferase
MSTSILILAPAQYRIPLVSIIEMTDAHTEVRFVSTREELLAFFEGGGSADRLIGFCTGVIVPAHILAALPNGAYNFHPGPPRRPGSGASHLALYEGDRRFGVTAHSMVEKVDSGPIVGLLEFNIREGADISWLRPRMDKAAFKLFIHLCPALVRSSPLAALPVSWTGRAGTKRELEALIAVPPDVSETDLNRRRRAFGDHDLSVTLYGLRFRAGSD